MSETIYIYGLFDPRNYSLRYIGKSNNPDLRLKCHLSEVKHGRSGNTHKDNWIKQLLAEGLEPSIEILEECDEDNWQEIEKAWIEECREKGLYLTNIADGGEGFQTGESHSLYGRKGKNHHSYGRKHSEESRRRMSLAQKGKVMSESTRKKLSDHFKGKKRSLEDRRKMSEGRKGCKVKPFTEKHKRKMSLAMRMRNALNRQDVELLEILQKEYKSEFGKYHSNYLTGLNLESQS